MKRYLILILPLILTNFGCGGGDGTLTTNPLGPSSSVRTGVFVDSPVEGLAYTTVSGKGLTDAAGEFAYRDGETVRFAVGDIVLGEAPANYLMTPMNLVPGAVSVTNPTVVNIARFLQTLDEDGFLGNGILLSDNIRQQAIGKQIDFTKSVTEFEQDPEVLALLGWNIQSPGNVLVPVVTAVKHLAMNLPGNIPYEIISSGGGLGSGGMAKDILEAFPDPVNSNIVAVAGYIFPSSGYAFTFTSVVEEESEIVISGVITSPGLNCYVLTVITYGEETIRFAYSDKTILFDILDVPTQC